MPEADQKPSIEEWQQQLGGQLKEAFQIVGNQNKELHSRVEQLAAELAKARQAPQGGGGLSREELSQRAQEEFFKDTAGFMENVGTAARRLAQEEVRQAMQQRDQQEEHARQADRFWNEFYGQNPDMGQWQGEFQQAWLQADPNAAPYERATQAANMVRTKIAGAQATAIEMQKREMQEKRMASSSPVQVGWQKLFSGGGQGEPPKYDAGAELGDVVSEWRKSKQKKSEIDWSKVQSQGVRG